MLRPASRLTDALQEHRGFLLHLARAQLGDAGLAEDVVQEAVLAAWQAFPRFEQRSNIRTWLVGILRFKIVDALRQRQRQPCALPALLEPDHAEESLQNLLFDVDGQWRDMPHDWWSGPGSATQRTPDGALQEKQLLQLLQVCLTQLSAQTSQVFLMREYLGLNSAEVAAQLGLQAGHVRVILLRARLALRTCLELRLGPMDARVHTAG
jgi:RNA polymerase sigma-70 factor (ECF subfamily)